MCGLVCAIAKHASGFNRASLDAFHDLLYIDAVRGEDSTGVFLVEKDGDVSLAKEASHAYKYMQAPEYKDLMNQAFKTGRFLVGHNRKATKGSIVDANAHPFIAEDKIVLVHNGTLFGDHKDLADTEVDSHAIAYTLAKHPNDVEGAMDKIFGAYALIWYDVENDNLNFLRNSQRPLHFFESDNAWLFASESSMLDYVIARNKITGPKKVTSEFEENTHTAFKWNKNHMDVTNTKLVQKTYSRAPTTTTYSYGSGYSRYDDDVYDGCNLTPIQDRYPNDIKGKVKTSYSMEEAIAETLQCSVTKREYVAVEKDLKGEWVELQFKDFLYVNDKDASSGYFVYGTVVTDSDMIGRIIFDRDTDENLILDLTQNQRKGWVEIANPVWRPYSNMGPNGYVILFCTNYTPVNTAVEAAVATLVNGSD
jgi:predicted glutamine amidotransferase